MQLSRFVSTRRSAPTSSPEQAATRSYLDYQRGDATETEVHRLQAAETAACDAHLDAINAVAGVTS